MCYDHGPPTVCYGTQVLCQLIERLLPHGMYSAVRVATPAGWPRVSHIMYDQGSKHNSVPDHTYPAHTPTMPYLEKA